MVKILVKPSIEKIIYSEKYLHEWDLFIENSRNGTFLNTKKFLNYHPPQRFNDSSLLFFKKNLLIAVMPAVIVMENNEKILYSHPGSTYGGIIIGKNANLKLMFDIIDEIIIYCQENDINKILIKTPPKIYHNYPSDEVDFALFKKGFKIKKIDLTTSIYLPKFKTERGVSMTNSCERTIRSAEKQGIKIQESDDFSSYWHILKKNLKAKYDNTPVHTLKEIKLLKSLFPHNISLFGAFKDNKMVGGTLIFMTSTTIHTQYIAMLYEYQKLRPINALFNHLIQYGFQEGYLYLNFGVSTEGFGEDINWGLINFKESFGGRGILHEFYSLSLNK